MKKLFSYLKITLAVAGIIIPIHLLLVMRANTVFELYGFPEVSKKHPHATIYKDTTESFTYLVVCDVEGVIKIKIHPITGKISAQHDYRKVQGY